MLTRKYGRAPVGPVQLPRILGVEATGYVAAAPGNEARFPVGSIAMTAVGGMGIMFDGGYAEYVCVSKDNVQAVRPEAEKLGWDLLEALPEMLQTAHRALFRSLKLKSGDKLLIRGGTTSVGLATAAAIAKQAGTKVFVTTRKANEKTKQLLLENGADDVIIDDGTIANTVKKISGGGVDKVLELVGGSTLNDSLTCLSENGICCLVGLVGGSASIADFSPLAAIQIGRYLTAYGERTFAASNLPLDHLVDQIENGSLKIRIGKVFNMDDIVEAHECMERIEALGKIVVLTGTS